MMMILMTSFEDLRNDWALSQQEGSFLFNDLRAEESESFFAINDDYQMMVIISKQYKRVSSFQQPPHANGYDGSVCSYE